MTKKYYRHYKDKPYRLRGIVKHSETLEEMAYYETRYENANGRHWVRPKEMFFEDVHIHGQTQPRFRAIELQIEQVENITSTHIEILGPLIRDIFGEWDSKWFHSTFNNHKKFFLLLARFEEDVVGFKLGYELNDLEFYSWLGGVLPEYRGLGVAQELMQVQHHWCRGQNYKKVSTKTQNRFSNMLILNIQSGFEIIGTHRDDTHQLKIILEKSLVESQALTAQPKPT